MTNKYDQLKARSTEIESALVTKNHEAHDLEIENRQLKAENELLRNKCKGDDIDYYLICKEHDALRKQLDEAREVIKEMRYACTDKSKVTCNKCKKKLKES